MKWAISIKLGATPEQSAALVLLQREFTRACNLIVPRAAKNNCSNPVQLHHLVYSPIRITTELGSQMVCNAIKSVARAFKVFKKKKTTKNSTITFKSHSAVPFDKRTYSIKEGALSLYTLSGRILVPMVQGVYNENFSHRGIPKEATLVYRDKSWYFNLILDIPDVQPVKPTGKVLGIDLGENVLAATSSGKIFDGKKLRHERNRALALRSQLQSNGSKRAKQLLKKTSGKEARHVTHVNHLISKALIQEALDAGCDTLALEKLTNIRKRIKMGKRMNMRLHSWAWAQLQAFIVYKAQAAGLKVLFVNPAYTSKVCSDCGSGGLRTKHRFVCKNCGIQRHSDLNAARNIRRIAVSADAATGTVSCPYVAAL